MRRYKELEQTPLEERTLTAVLDGVLQQFPDKVALSDSTQRLTYAQMWDRALQLAGGLESVGIEPLGRVVMLLENHVDNVLTWVALTLIGAVEVPINTSYMGEMLSYVINDSGARVAIVDETLLNRFEAIAGDLEAIETVIVRSPSRGSFPSISSARSPQVLDFAELTIHSPAAPLAAAPWDLMGVVYTSGTTGRSKGVLCPHAHAWGHASAVGSTDAEDIRYVVLPQFHIAGQWGGVYRAFIGGATAHVANGFHVSTFWNEVQSVGATTSQLVGTMAAFLLAQTPSPKDSENSLREIHMIPLVPDPGGFSERFGVGLFTGYGNTEIGTVLSNPQADRLHGMGSVRPGYEVRVVDENDIEVPRGRPGEFVVRGALPWTTMIGYQGEAEKTVEAFRNGWLHSGDAVIEDEDGLFTFADRIDDAIRRRGENVSSFDVEVHVNQFPGVVESAVVAVPSEHLEDEIKAVVVLAASSAATEEQIYRFLADRLPYFMVPRYIELREDLPKTPTAKVRKNELRSLGVEGVWDSHKAGLVAQRSSL
jgi:crotonobetaine/carnitine-CoA ligase